MPLTFADIIRLRTRDELRDALLTELAARGFPVTSWSLGGVARTLVEGVAQGTADLWLGVSAVARGMLLDTAEGDWLTELARSHYDTTRIQATFARHTVRMSFTAGGPGSISPGQLLVAAPSGITFRSVNTSTETIPAAGGYLDVVVQCERVGLAGNTAPSILITPAAAGLSMTWQALAESAVDEETDAALRQRCRDRWATLAVGQGPRAAYRYWLQSATMDGTPTGTSCGITRVGFLAPPGDGTVPVRIAGASGLVGPEQLTAARAYVELRRPHTDTPGIKHATVVPVSIAGTVRFFDGENTSEHRAAAENAARGYVNGIAIGDDIDSPTVDEAGIKAAIYAAVPGKIRDVDLTTLDVTIGAGVVAVPDTIGLAWA